MKRARSTDSTNASNEPNANGLNQLSSGVVEPSGAVPAMTCQAAKTTNSTRARYCTPSSTFCIRSPISSPRQLIQLMSAMNTTPVRVTTNTFSARSGATSSQK